MDDVIEILRKDKFCFETVGLELVEIGPGRAKVKMAIGDNHLNGLGSVQGGAIFTLADFALAAAANSHGVAAVTINASITYVRAVSEGMLFAEAREEDLHSRLATYSVRVTTGEDVLVATMQGTVYRKNGSAAV